MKNSKKSCKTSVDDFIKSSLQKLKIIEKSEFFIAYLRFDFMFKEFKKEYISRVETRSEYINGTAKIYFSKVFEDKSNIEIKCKEKPFCGAQVSSILLNITGVSQNFVVNL